MDIKIIVLYNSAPIKMMMIWWYDGVMISYGTDADSLFSGQERVQQTPVGTMTLAH